MPTRAASPPSDAPGQSEGLTKGATIGRYVVLGLLGRGGMGEVYAAYDPELDRKIAVKLLRARDRHPADDSDGRTRLLREAQAIARLSHPNVVVVYDVGTFRESVFIAMEFVEGPTVGYWLHAERRAWRAVLEVFLAAGQGLAAAHEAGLIHRDFKPDNVMITKDRQVRVMDFGLARQVLGADEPPLPPMTSAEAEMVAQVLADGFDPNFDPDATANLAKGGAAPAPTSPSGGYLRVKLTQTGAILGTPAYMAPEQFAGGSGDARSDQFSFCVALYEGLYGQRPFAGESLVALMANVVAGTISDPPPQARVPAFLRRVLLRGLHTEPDHRFPSMAALLAALAHDPAVRRRRWVAAAAGGLLVAAAALGAQRFTAGQRAMCAGGPGRVATVWGPERRSAVERAFTAAGKGRGAQAFAGAAALIDQYLARWTGMYSEACQAAQVRGEQSAEVMDLRMACLGERLSDVGALTDVFSQAAGSVVDNAVSAAGALPGLDRCADVAMLRAVIKPPDDPAKRARVAAIRDEVARVNALASSGQCQQAANLGRNVVDEATALGYRALEAEALYARGRLGDDCIDPKAAVEQLEESVFAAEASRHDEIAIKASVYLATQYGERAHDARMSRHWVRHAEAILARFPGHAILEAWIAVEKGFAFFSEGRYEEALREHRRALALKEAALGPFHVDPAISALDVALTLHELGRDAEAEPIIGRAIDVFRKLHGDDSTQLAVALLDQTEILTTLRRFDAAHLAIERALAIWRERDASPFFIGHGLLDLGRLRLAEEQLVPARATLGEAAALLAKYDPPTAAQAQFALARALWPSPRDRPRSLELARKARAAIGQEPGAARATAEVDAWLREHQAL